MSLSIKQLQDIANILRRDSIEATTAAGSGHPTSCLSCAEIISCLFFREMHYDVKNPNNLDNDEFILSKGHAAPIYYAALKRAGCIKSDLKTLRKLNSPLEGHPMPRSLPWVKVATGSLGQGLSIGLGFSLAAKFSKRKAKTFVLLGDSETAEGSVWEALELAPLYKLNNLVALFDVNRLGETGETILGHDLKSYKKRISAFGWNTIVINGHSIKQILSALKKASKSKKPTAIICKTYKGRGVSFLENKAGKHGKALKPIEAEKALAEIPNTRMPTFSPKTPRHTKISKEKAKPIKFTKYKLQDSLATRDAYGNILQNIAQARKNIVTVDAELSDSTRSDKIRTVKGAKYIEAYIAEQNMVGIALGLSKKELTPFCSTFSTFFTRAHDQLRMAAHSQGKIICAGTHAGISIGEDGVSQMGLEDIALFRDLPESTVLYPSDPTSTEKLVSLALKQSGITFIRLNRPKTPVLYKNAENFPLGDFKVLKKSTKDKITLIGSGITLNESLTASQKIKGAAVIDLYSIKPLNSKKLINFIKKHGNKCIITEDHYKAGGIGEALLSALKNSGIKIKHLYVKGSPHSGKSEELLKKYGIDSTSIIKASKNLI